MQTLSQKPHTRIMLLQTVILPFYKLCFVSPTFSLFVILNTIFSGGGKAQTIRKFYLLLFYMDFITCLLTSPRLLKHSSTQAVLEWMIYIRIAKCNIYNKKQYTFE